MRVVASTVCVDVPFQPTIVISCFGCFNCAVVARPFRVIVVSLYYLANLGFLSFNIVSSSLA